MKKCGGFTDDRDADDKVKGIALGVKADVEKALGATYAKFDAVKFATQVVAGVNYKIKVDVGDGKYVHVKVHVPLPNKNEPNKLLTQEAGKTLADPL